MKKLLLMLFLPALMLTACSEDQDGHNGRPDQMQVQFNGAMAAVQQTKVGGEQGTLWDGGEQVGIFMLKAGGTTAADVLTANAAYTASAGETANLTAAGDPIYYPEDGSNVQFIAYYPYNAAVTDTFTLPVSVADQSVQSNIDVLYAAMGTQSYNKASGTVNLGFVHKLSKLTFTVVPGGDLTAADLAGAKIEITNQQTAAEMAYDGTLTVTAGTPTTIAALTEADGLTGQAIVLPGATTGVEVSVTTAAGRNFTAAVTDANAEWTAGYQYDYQMVLGQGTVIFTGTITPWGDGGTQQLIGTEKEKTTVGIWILSEAGALQSKADLAYYDCATGEMHNQYYSELNGEPLGQVANFMGLFNDQLWIAISGEPQGSTSCIKVVDPHTGLLIHTIDMKGPDGAGDVVRQLAYADGKVYATTYFGGGSFEEDGLVYPYGGVCRIDAATYKVEAYTRVGDKPEGIAYRDGKLYVCNDATDPKAIAGLGTTISVVDAATFTQERLITVPVNPVHIQTASNGDIYFSTPEAYYSGTETEPSAMHKLDPATGAVTTYATPSSRFVMTDKYIYTGEFSYMTYMDSASRIDRQTGDITPFEMDPDYYGFFMFYGIGVNPLTGDVYMGGQGDDVAFYSASGETLDTFNVAVPYINTLIPIIE